VENTKKITRAMEMVAAAKLRRFQDFLESARPYTEGLAGLLDQLLAELPAG
jgi:F-type H+-transporting ATPase subunit gamma